MFTTGSRARSVLVALAVIAVAACSATGTGTPRSSRLANTSWILSTLGGRPMASGADLDLTFAVNQASGFGGCNHFNTTYTTDGAASLTFGPLAVTGLACGTGLDALERSYLAALGDVARYVVVGDKLTLSSATGGELLTYGAVGPQSIEGPWNVTAVNNGQQAVSSIPTGISAAMSFLPDGTIQGFGGCNNFNGTYSLTGNSITIGPLLGTKVSCGAPADTFESQFLAALPKSTKWSVTNGKLDLRDDDGAQQVAATSAIH